MFNLNTFQTCSVSGLYYFKRKEKEREMKERERERRESSDEGQNN